MNSQGLQIVLAPLRGLTESLFRNVYAEHFGGIDWAITPFLNTTGNGRIKPSQLKEVALDNNQRMPVVPQIISNTPNDFVEICKSLFDIGHSKVNWNLGCPFPRVARKGRGSGMLPFPERIEAFLSDVLSCIPNRLSIKMRLGRHDAKEIFQILPVLNRFPIDHIVLHPRTGTQMYDGIPDRDMFETCLVQTNHRIVYNGDITSVDGLQRLRERFPTLTTWMIGRGVLADVFLAERIKGISRSTDSTLERFIAFHNDLLHHFASILLGPTHVVDRMKGYWTYFTRSFNDGAAVLKQIRKCRHIERYTLVVNRFFDSQPTIKEINEREVCG